MAWGAIGACYFKPGQLSKNLAAIRALPVMRMLSKKQAITCVVMLSFGGTLDPVSSGKAIDIAFDTRRGDASISE